MNFIGWIRDLFGIQKDMYETKRTRLEIKKLEDAERQKIIFPATFEDVKKYDPKYQVLERRAREAADETKLDEYSPCTPPPPPLLLRVVKVLFWLIIFILFIVASLLIYPTRR